MSTDGKISRTVLKLLDGDLARLGSMNHRDKILLHFRSGGKFALGEKEREILDRCEQVQVLMLEHRGDRVMLFTKVKEMFNLQHREEVYRYIEDAEAVLGASYQLNKNYQRLIFDQQLQYYLKWAHTMEDGKLIGTLMKLWAETHGLDKHEVDIPTDLLKQHNFIAEFMPENFPRHLPPDAHERARQVLADAMKEIGMQSEEAKDVEYATE